MLLNGSIFALSVTPDTILTMIFRSVDTRQFYQLPVFVGSHIYTWAHVKVGILHYCT